ncbi:MAG: class II aldolase/adducin family protein [Elusimicrobiota bacterium]
MTEAELRRELVKFGRLLFERDYTPGPSGNLSARLGPDLFLITPTGRSKGLLAPEDLVVIDGKGRKVRGRLSPTSESAMHLLFYALRPEVRAVVHAHPPTATSFACAGLPLDSPLSSEFIEALGCAPLASYATPGTPEVPDSLRDLARSHDAVLLANHGVVTVGKDLWDAYAKMETIEHFAQISMNVRLLGREALLGEKDIRKLLEARAHYQGLDRVPERRPGCPASPSAKAVDPAVVEQIVRAVIEKLA